MADSCVGSNGILDDFYIPTYIFDPDDKATSSTPCSCSCPVVVFINTKSGGLLGSDLLKSYCSLLNKSQVFDLKHESPDKVLKMLFANLERLKENRDTVAGKIYQNLRLIVAGGDGTASWLLGVVSEMKLARPPPIAPVPFGTGNNLHFSFGWGRNNPGTDHQSVTTFLNQVKRAKEMKIDGWQIIMRMGLQKEGAYHPIAPLELPHALHSFHRVCRSDSLNMEGYHTFRGKFWNYFSMGMDSQVSYSFHAERKLHPERFKNQLANQITYLKLGCTQGWFCTSLLHDSLRNILRLTTVKIIKRPGQDWMELPIPQSIRSIICLNLPSFSGGLNPWGTPSKRKTRDTDLTAVFVDDGLLEVVGFRNAWHGLALLSPKGHATRLAQAHRVRFEFHRGAAKETYMRIDGEPWKQPLPEDNNIVVIDISYLGQVNILAADNCRSKSVNDHS